MIAEFREFLLKTNALALAVGVIIGVALGNVVGSLVNDIIMPPIGFILGGVDFTSLVFHLGDGAGGVDIRWGAFVNSIIAFLVIAFVVYQVSRMLIKEPPPAALKTCPFCKEANAIDATRCKACTSPI